MIVSLENCVLEIGEIKSNALADVLKSILRLAARAKMRSYELTFMAIILYKIVPEHEFMEFMADLHGVGVPQPNAAPVVGSR